MSGSDGTVAYDRWPRRWRLGYGSGLVAIMLNGALMQFYLGVMAGFLTQDFDLSRTQLGLLSTMLVVVASGGPPLAGILIDAVGARRVVLVPFVAAATGFAVAATSTGYAGLLAAVATCGIGMAFGNPLTNLLIVQHVPDGRRGVLIGLKQAGVPLGGFWAGIVLPAASLSVGWRAVTAVVAVLLLATGAFVVAVTPPDRELPVERRQGGRPVRILVITAWLGPYAFLMGAGLSALTAYLPLYAIERHSVTAATAGAVLSVVNLLGVVSRVFWGVVSERLRSPALNLTVLAAVATLAQVAVGVSPLTGIWLLWIAAVVLGASSIAWNTVAMVAIVRTLGADGTGRASGVVQAALFAGFAVGPTGTGVLVDNFAWEPAWIAVAATFLASAVIAASWRLCPDPVVDVGDADDPLQPSPH